MSDDSIDYWIKRISKIDEFRHKVENQLKNYSDKRLAKANSDRTKSVDISVGTREVYYPTKKLSNKTEFLQVFLQISTPLLGASNCKENNWANDRRTDGQIR